MPRLAALALAVIAGLLLGSAAALAQGARPGVAPKSAAADPGEVAEAIRASVEGMAQGSAVTIGGEPLRATAALATLYRSRAFAPLWTSAQIDDLERAVAAAPGHGLASGRYHAAALPPARARLREHPTAAAAADVELLASDAFALLLADLSAGRVNPETLDTEWHARRPGVDVAALVSGLAEGRTIDALVASQLPTEPGYARVVDALARYRALPAAGWPEVEIGEPLGPGSSGPRVDALRRRLATTGDLARAGSGPWADDLTEAVKRFQGRHGLPRTGVAAEATQAALSVPLAARIAALEATLERWRWLPAAFGERSIVVNIAAYTLHGRSPGLDDVRMNVVVGKPYRRTPVFSGRMTHLVWNPTWTVPPGIMNADVLPAVRKDVGYLAKKRMTVFQGWGADAVAVDPTTVDWSKATGRGPYRIVQAPGPDNALGAVKFMFPNRFNVYLHDTPAREHFNLDDRAFSSGCIRLSDPVGLARWVLAGQPDGKPAAIDAARASGEERTVNLAVPVDVHILYWTAWVDDAGVVQFRKDVYERDARLLSALAAAGPPAP